jgi:serine/threonine protein kinase/class 3 adenylate cyclase
LKNDRYHILEQIGVGADGIAYTALAADRTTRVEVRDLSGIRGDSRRWADLVRRLAIVARLDHPAALRLIERMLDDVPPVVVLDACDSPSLLEALGERRPLAVPEAIDLILRLAEALAEAHRLGLRGGWLMPGALRGTGSHDLKIDFTGIDASSSTSPPGLARVVHQCQAPELIDGAPPGSPADIFGLGALAAWFIAGPSADGEPSLRTLLDAMTAVDPEARPTASDVVRLLSFPRSTPSVAATAELTRADDAAMGAFVPVTVVGEETIAATQAQAATATGEWRSSRPEEAIPERLGRFRLVEKLGEGGMGAVYRGEDEADGSIVAVKVLRPEWASRPQSLQRFRKEARLLAELNNPYITNLLDVNEDRGHHYIVLEFVAGPTLDAWLRRRGAIEEPAALAVMADVARGLVDAHRVGIVHRDIKPSNILLVEDEALSRRESSPATPSPRVKLSDFGLARHAVEQESQMLTQSGVIVGTPAYMAPEQCSGGEIGPRTDVYSMGATLYHLIAGRPPFEAQDWRSIITQHLNEPPPSLRKLKPGASEGLCRLVDKALAKAPEARYADSWALLHDLERLLRGEPTGLPMHPVLPVCDPAEVLHFDFEWDLESSPRRLWPLVANTDRLDRAIGFSAIKYTFRFDPEHGVRRFLSGRKAGQDEEGEEHPYEWVEGRRLGVFREYSRGPFNWVVSIVELTPRAGGGTTLAHRLRLVPRGALIRWGSRWGIGVQLRRELEKVYRRIDAYLAGKFGKDAEADPFEPVPELPQAQRERIASLLGILIERGNDPEIVARLGHFLARAPAPEVARIRPLALARRWGLEPEAVVATCLHAANVGLLVLLWDILCPVCRLPSEVKGTLRELKDHGNCEVCHLNFELDFANSVELIFRAASQIRDVDTNTYCAAGPSQSPHVVAQVRVAAGERMELELDLAAGDYRLCSPQLPWSVAVRIQPHAPLRRWALNLDRGPLEGFDLVLGDGGQVIELNNESRHEVLARIERAAPRDDALTAARVSSLAVFRELFPTEILSPGQLVNIATITLLLTALDRADDFYDEMGDARAFGVLYEHFQILNQVIRREGGALIKTVNEGILASFPEPAAAVRAALALPELLSRSETTRDLRIRASIHQGPAMVATLDDHLDYFGTTVNLTTRALTLARGSQLVLTRAVAGDSSVATLLQSLGLKGEVRSDQLPGFPFGPLLILGLVGF